MWVTTIYWLNYQTLTWSLNIDVVAIDAVYHRVCLTRIYRKAETVGCDVTKSNETQIIRAYVLHELLDFTEYYRGSGESQTVVT